VAAEPVYDPTMADLTQRVEKLEAQMAYLLKDLGISTQQAPAWSPSPEIVDLVMKGKKIAAIKAYREQTGAGLKEAMAVIDSLDPRVGHGG
jgi:ribosomal protein L7/L12